MSPRYTPAEIQAMLGEVQDWDLVGDAVPGVAFTWGAPTPLTATMAARKSVPDPDPEDEPEDEPAADEELDEEFDEDDAEYDDDDEDEDFREIDDDLIDLDDEWDERDEDERHDNPHKFYE